MAEAALTLEDVPREELESAVIRFAGDSGDGMQLTGGRFTETAALAGNDLTTFPDFPAEIRAPVGTTYGVSAFQINFGSRNVMTSGDVPDVLVCMNPAALKVNVGDLREGGQIIVDTGTFTDKNLQKAGYDANPLDDDSLSRYRIMAIDISKLTLESVKECGVSKKEGLRAKNLWTLGLIYWLYDRDIAVTVKWLDTKFKKLPNIAAANIACLKAGHAFGETAELPDGALVYEIKPATFQPGLYRTVTGTEALAWGLVAGAKLAGLKLVFSSYPITPASSVLHVLARLKAYDVVTFQAEDEIAAAGAAIGASYAGALGVTSSSGPGVALKTEALGLAITAELPLILLNSQRAGPSTGLPTKTEQSDLYLAVYGRNADAPLVVLAARSSAEAFDVAIEAVRLATRYMTPVVVLSDTFIANAAEPWRLPDVGAFEPFPVEFRTEVDGFQPYERDPETLARPLGQARHARPRAPHRRPGEGLRHGQRLLRPRKPSAHDQRAAREDRPHRGRYPRADGRSGAHARPARGGRLGLHLRADQPGRRAQPGGEPLLGLAHPSAAPQPAATQSRRPPRGLREGAGARDEHGPAHYRAAQPLLGAGHKPAQGHRQALQDRRDHGRDPRPLGGMR